ncbi:MAG: P-loop containing nucleoside triphosphate hydrolase protein [Piptocephalis tieghemiana]|nr:MAG: P-loop containing nucleoside triphosphate hydrolase protein [Piptocephalis tieghemiana]
MSSKVFPYFVDYILHHCKDPEKLVKLKRLRKLVDLRRPQNWYSATRRINRRIILHVGPTNSGKTYRALERLKQAQSGAYAGPLRLLAHEVYTRFNAAGFPCDLITGEESCRALGKDTPAPLISCTVEMTPIDQDFDVVVVDEIQMLADPQRGSSWTHALLSVKAKELHLCGEPAAVPIIQKLAAMMDETVEVNHYDRLSPLSISDSSLNGDLKKLRKGDCVVVFSRKGIFSMKKRIESLTKLKCAVIYGALPSEIRVEQAELFNQEKGGYDVMIASDAVGMGLNLNIGRIIFESLTKWNGTVEGWVASNQVRQIAGRAGRFNTKFKDGCATTLYEKDLEYLNQCIQEKPKDIDLAVIYPTPDHMAAFECQFPDKKPSDLLHYFQELAQVEKPFTIFGLESQKEILSLIEHLPLFDKDRYTLSLAPVKYKDELNATIFQEFARGIAYNQPVQLEDHLHINSSLVGDLEDHVHQLSSLESKHHVILLYLWLSFRFESTINGRERAQVLKARLGKLISQVLKRLHEKGKGAHKSKLLPGPSLKSREARGARRFPQGEGPRSHPGPWIRRKPRPFQSSQSSDEIRVMADSS